MFQQGQLKSLAVATGLILLNVAVMWAFVFTPLSAANSILFEIFFVGVLIYGALLTGGIYIAKRGIRSDDTPLALAGTSMIQFAYGMFGAGVISMLLGSQAQAFALGATAVVTTSIAVVCGLLVFLSNHDFSRWGQYANYFFMGVLGVSLLATFIRSLAFIAIMIAFLLALVGFIVYLIHQIYQVKVRPGKPFMNGIGLYAAYMGVFVEILQMVVYMFLDE